jgi:hypothetical protein
MELLDISMTCFRRKQINASNGNEAFSELSRIYIFLAFKDLRYIIELPLKNTRLAFTFLHA